MRRSRAVLMFVIALAVVANVVVAPSPAAAGRQMEFAAAGGAAVPTAAQVLAQTKGLPHGASTQPTPAPEASPAPTARSRRAPVVAEDTSSTSSSSTSSSSTSSTSSSTSSTSTSTSTSTTTPTATTAAPTTTVAPAVGSNSFTDATGDNPPGLDPHGDLTTVTANYTTMVNLTATVASPIDPAADPNWKSFVTGIVWFMDVNGDQRFDFGAVIAATTTGELLGGLADPNINKLACDVTPAFAGGVYSVSLPPSCIGTPNSFEIFTVMLYNTATTESDDAAPNASLCCAVTQSLPVAEVTTVAPATPAVTGTLARTGVSALIRWYILVGMVCLAAGCNCLFLSTLRRVDRGVRLPAPPPTTGSGVAKLLRGSDRARWGG